MSKRFLAATIAGAALLASPAHAAMIAGWDFSQYVAPGVLTTDPGTFEVAPTLSANYSDVCANPATCGTMFNNGQFGSSSVVTLDQQLVPTDGSLLSNDFTSDPTLSPLSLAPVSQQLSVVFSATLGSQSGTEWTLAFGGQTAEGGTNVNILFSLDGQNYNPLGTAAITTNDTPYSFAVNANGASQLFLRFDFSGNWDPLGAGTVTGLPKIDNVSISANVIPEPGTVILLLSGLAGLAAVGRRRS